MMTQETVHRLFEETGALLSGHFLLSSGRHSDRYLQAALVLQNPGHALAFGRELADRFRAEPVTAVVGPALGGIVIAFATAAGLPGTRALFTERENGRFTLRRGFSLGPEDRVLVIEDIITTGGSTREVIELVAASGARVVGVGAIAERGAAPVDFGVRKETLLRLVIESHLPETCPLCRQGLPLVKPGSRTR